VTVYILHIEVKGEDVPVLNYAPRHEDVLWDGGIGSRIHDLGTIRR